MSVSRGDEQVSWPDAAVRSGITWKEGLPRDGRASRLVLHLPSRKASPYGNRDIPGANTSLERLLT